MPSRSRTYDVALIAGFAALIAVSAQLEIKTGVGVPFSLQTFAVLLSGAVLGPLRGFLTVALYLAGGAVGLPIFSGGAAGVAHFTGPTAGYLLAFPFAAALCGFIVWRNHGRRTDFTLVFTAGLLSSFVFIHTLGPLNLAWRADMVVKDAFIFDTQFFPGDVVKNVVMALVATAVHRAFPDLLRRPSGSRPEPVPQSEPQRG
jgi:biotin transport system substrate-specific component